MTQAHFPFRTEEEIAANIAEGNQVVAELRAAGLAIDNLDNLSRVADVRPYMPILESWWRKATRFSTKEIIVSAFKRGGLRAQALVPELIAEFSSEPGTDPVYADDLAFALEALAGRNHLDQLLAVLLDDTIPMEKRSLLLYPIHKFRDQRLVPIYMRLLQDPQAILQLILSGLARNGSPEVLEAVRSFEADANPSVRAYARRAVARIERELAAKSATLAKGQA